MTSTKSDEATKHLVDAIRERLKLFKISLPDPNVVKEIVLVGGSSRLKCVRKVLIETFPGASFKESINPDEAAVYGAAVLAHYFQRGMLQINENGFEVCPMTPGVQPEPEVPSSYTKPRCSDHSNTLQNPAFGTNLKTVVNSLEHAPLEVVC